MRTKRLAEYKPILVQLHHAQVESLDKIKSYTGKSRTELIREAVSELIGRYQLPRQGGASGR